MSKHPPKLPFGTLSYTVTVDYRISKEKMFKACGFNWNSEIVSSVPITGQGKHKRRLFLIPFFKSTFKGIEGLALIEKLQLTPAHAEDLLALLRDYRHNPEQKAVGWIAAYGTTWVNKYGEKDCLYSYQDSLSAGKITGLWGGDHKGYLLAVAEDSIKRKIHKTPHPNLPYPQPKGVPTTSGAKISPANIPTLPNALKIEVEVDYGKTAEEMVAAAGFYRLEKTSGIEGVPEISDIPLHSNALGAKPKQKVKRTLVLVPLKKFGDGDIPTDVILQKLNELNLQPAKAEDLLSLTREERRFLQNNWNVRRMMAFGFNWTFKDTPICLRVVGENELRIGQMDKTEWGSDHWTLCYLPKKYAKQSK